MNNIAYPKPDYKNPFYNCYKNGDNPVLVFTGITNGSLKIYSSSFISQMKVYNFVKLLARILITSALRRN